MVHNRYPADLPVTLEDFKSSGYESVIASLDDYPLMWAEFSKAADVSNKNGQLKIAKVLWLLADACSMKFEPDNYNNPFIPLISHDGNRSVIPEDFTDEDILFFSQIVMDISHNMLKARIADIVWIRNRSLRFALMAIDSYIMNITNAITMATLGNNCLRRAINLSKTLKNGASDRLEQIVEKIFNALISIKIEDGGLGIWLANLLIDSDIEKSKLLNAAKKLEELTKNFKSANDNFLAQEYANITAKFYNILDDNTKSIEMLVCQAECLEKCATDDPSKLSAINFYEKAIQMYRSIPNKERKNYKIDDKITTLRLLITESTKEALLEMNTVESPGIDISAIIKYTEQLVEGKTTQQALLNFVNLSRLADSRALREQSIRHIKKYPLSVLFPTMIIRDGRVIAKIPGISPGEENEDVIFFKMVQNYLTYIGLVVQGKILPAKNILYLEHCICKNDIYLIVKNSPAVPLGRELLITKALYAGFENDFITYIHLGIPQFENIVRFYLKENGVITSRIDQYGVESENSLKALVNLPEMVKIFGEDLTFEIKALLCSPVGPNLRNETAHGLIGEDKCYSIYSIYSWWLMFKIVFNSFWSLKSNTTDQEKLSPPEEN